MYGEDGGKKINGNGDGNDIPSPDSDFDNKTLFHKYKQWIGNYRVWNNFGSWI